MRNIKMSCQCRFSTIGAAVNGGSLDLSKTYLIPKVWVIDYVLSEHYAEYKKKLKVQI